MGRIKQIIVILLILGLGGGCFYLYNLIQTRPDVPVNTEKEIELGSYTETYLSLPDMDDGEELVDLVYNAEAAQLELYSCFYNKDKSLTMGYKQYIYNTEKEEFEVAYPDFLALPEFSSNNYVIEKLEYSDNGNLYILMHKLSDMVITPADDTSEENGEAAESTAEAKGSEEKETQKDPEQVFYRYLKDKKYLEQVGVTGLYRQNSDGNILLAKSFSLFGHNMTITDEIGNSYTYNLNSGELLASAPGYAGNTSTLDDSYMYTMNISFNGIVKTPLDSTNTKVSVTSKLASKADESNTISLWAHKASLTAAKTASEANDFRIITHDRSVTSDKSKADEIYLSCEDGVYSYSKTTGKLTTLLSGTSVIFGKPSVTQLRTFMADGSIYALSSNKKGDYYISKIYRPELSKETEKKDFTISSYERIPIMKEIVVTFAKAHPSLNVIYQPASETMAEGTIDSYSQILSDEFKNKNAADVIICDGIDTSKFAANGSFLSLTSFIEPLVVGRDLFKEIIYSEPTENVYTLPVGFNAYLYYGRASLIENSGSLDEMKNYAMNNNVKFFQNEGSFEIADIITSFYHGNIASSNVVDSAKLQSVLETFAALAAPAVEQYAYSSSSFSKIPSAEEANGMKDMRVASVGTILAAERLTELIKNSDVKIATANGIFEPVGMVGINAECTDTSAAQDFVKSMYSEEIQSSDILGALPLSRSILTDMLSEEEANTTYSGTGTKSDVNVTTEITEFVKILDGLNSSYYHDNPLSTGLKAYLELYFDGTIDAETAASGAVKFSEKESAYTTFDASKNKAPKILLIGSNYMLNAKMKDTLTNVLTAYGMEPNVVACIHENMSLGDQIIYLTGEKYDTYTNVRDADIIILCENGANVAGAVSAAYHVEAYKKPDAKVYYLMTDDENSELIKKRMMVFSDITFIPLYGVHSSLAGTKSVSVSAIKKDGTGGDFMGYIDAMAIMKAIFKTDISDVKESLITNSMVTAKEDSELSTDDYFIKLNAAIAKYIKKYYGIN
jgi:hypothetical protein